MPNTTSALTFLIRLLREENLITQQETLLVEKELLQKSLTTTAEAAPAASAA